MTDNANNEKASARRTRPRKPQLRVVFDTNVLYVSPTNLGSATDLVRDEIASLISDSRYPDLDILWYLPEVVRHERQYQMETEALKLRIAINKIERLLGHNLALTDKALLDHVKTKIDEKETELGLREIRLNHGAVDWDSLIRAALYRKPPFQAGEKEKGFRDALIAESFLQLVEESPKTPTACRVVLITSDELLTNAVKERISGFSNCSILPGIEELKGLINTLVSSVSEDFIAQLKPKASRFFFISAEDKDTLYYRENIRDRINEKFKSDLEKSPDGTTFRTDGTWYVSPPNFFKKDGRRIFWVSRIEIEVEAGTVSKEGGLLTLSSLLSPTITKGRPTAGQDIQTPKLGLGGLTPLSAGSGFYGDTGSWTNVAADWGAPSQARVVTQKGRDIFEVLWSVEVTTTKTLKKAEIHELTHVGLKTQPIT